MVEAAPAAAFVVVEPDLLFQLLIIAFDAPVQFDGVDERVEGDVERQGGKPRLRRLLFALGPFDDQPFLGPELGAQIVAMGRMDAHARETPLENVIRAFAPFDDLPGLIGQAERQRLDGDGLTLVIAARKRDKGRRPLPLQGLTCAKGRTPGGPTLVVGATPMT
jgi:hypothetical protein